MNINLNPRSLLNRILGGEKPEPGVNTPPPNPTIDFIRAVWSAPALYNRATRRRVRLWGRIWRWDLNAHEDTRRTYVPRYIRRHYNRSLLDGTLTRRERRHKNRIMRIAKAKGMVR